MKDISREASVSINDDIKNVSEGKDEVDIDLNDPDVENAAFKIQAGFKGMKARKEVSQIKATSIVNYKDSSEKATTFTVSSSQLELETAEDHFLKEIKDKQKKRIDIDLEESNFKVMEVKKVSVENIEDITEKFNKVATKEENQVLGEININLDDPDVEKAATKIQAGYKGMKKRKEILSKKKEMTVSNNELIQNENEKEKIAEKLNVYSNNQKENEVEIAAINIPVQQNDKESTKKEKETFVKESAKVERSNRNRNDNEEEIDIDLLDPEVEIAATKIQSGFKGMKARKEVSEMKVDSRYKTDEKETPNAEESKKSNKDNEEEINIDLLDPDVDIAATKIQAGFKGMKARKEVSAKKGEPKHKLKDEDMPKVEESKIKSNDNKEKIDIDLLDPDVEIAATKIQAGFKGMKARKEVSAMKGELTKKIH